MVDPKDLTSKARTLLNEKKYEEALKVYDECLAIDPINEDALKGKASSLRRLNRYEEALQIYDKAIEINPKEEWTWILKGETLSDLQRYEEALLSYDKAIEANPKEYWGWICKGNIQRNLKRYEDALLSYDKAIEINPKEILSRNNKGDILRDLKRYEEALFSYEKALEIDPKDVWAWLNKGKTYNDLKKYEEALFSYDKAIEINPKMMWVWIYEGNTFRDLKRFEEALQIYDKAIEIDPTALWAWIYKGDTFRDLKRYEEALLSYDKAIEINPQYGMSWFIKGNLLVAMGKLSEALNAFEKALQYFRTDQDISGENLANNWILDIKKRIEEQENKTEPTVEVKILRQIKVKLQRRPDEDPLARIKEREEEYARYFAKKRTIKSDDCFLAVLRRWNSFTPKIPGRVEARRGGGYFLVWQGKGIVIDPGFDFLDNFDKAGYSIQDIDAVVLTHAHTDHTADFEALLCLKYEERERLHNNRKVDLFLNLGTMHKFMGWISRLEGIGNVVTLNSGDSIEPKGYDLILRPMAAKHSEVIGEKCIGLVVDLRKSSKIVLRLGITSDTGWSSNIQNQYRRCNLLCVHLGSVGQNEFNEDLPLKGRKRLYGQHLGLIGTINMVKSIKPQLSVITEFGEELGSDRCHIATCLDRAFLPDRRCVTGDIGLKIRLPDLYIYCNICRDYKDHLTIVENLVRSREEVVYLCSSHGPQEILDRLIV